MPDEFLPHLGPGDWAPYDARTDEDNSRYLHTCTMCGRTFLGHKGRRGGLCRVCYMTPVQAGPVMGPHILVADASRVLTPPEIQVPRDEVPYEAGAVRRKGLAVARRRGRNRTAKASRRHNRR